MLLIKWDFFFLVGDAGSGENGHRGRWTYYNDHTESVVWLYIDKFFQESSEKQEVKWSSAQATVSVAELLDFNIT